MIELFSVQNDLVQLRTLWQPKKSLHFKPYDTSLLLLVAFQSKNKWNAITIKKFNNYGIKQHQPTRPVTVINII
ncbi:CLUMA_CG002335, isoform A [Clunio marinus]|uniref:CLUMA_CG002335, isoform A n=1 Tax=Clunio marinus TaxID=568069 RepID=A0A1J1HQE4_9DIPT|nr:CLUMA_CG002335, isoform A [Clunio marinus]